MISMYLLSTLERYYLSSKWVNMFRWIVGCSEERAIQYL